MNYQITFNNNINSCLREAKTFGFAMLGDFATIRRMPLLNIVGSLANSPPVVLEVKNSTPQLKLGKKKDAKYVSECFLKHLKKLDPTKTLVDLLFFDGASNMQIGGQVIADVYPRITCLHGVEHSIALVFSDWAKIDIIQVSTIYVVIFSILYHIDTIGGQ